MSYNIKGELTFQFAQLKSPPEGIYQRQDEIGQSFTSGRLMRQGEVVRDPNSGSYESQVAARHYYGADDRLMAVQRYSWRSADFRDGTWEEYRYDALGRRIMTRTRRDPNSPYDAFVSGPLCLSSSTPVCKSFTERVWWDGDQALVESRTPEGASDVSNNGLVGNVHALTLDEPLAVITPNTSETRIINYNWRGQGMSSVYPNGHPGDYSTGNGVAEIDWPAATQAQTYFTPALGSTPDNNAKMWLGTFVANGQGTTGMLYRRNRYFDTNTGRFTQEDPIGIAGGLNAYGFASGDPVNFSDPFGLCPTEMGGNGKTKTIGDCPEGSKGRRKYISGTLDSPGLADPFLFLGGVEADEAAAIAGEVEANAARAYGLAMSGSRHAGMIRNYMSKSAAELSSGIASFERNVADHLDWIQNPTSKVSDFFSRSAEYQAGLLNKWKTDAIRNASQANILRGLLKELQ